MDPGRRLVLTFMVRFVPRQVLVDLLERGDCQDEHERRGRGGLAVRYGDGADGLEAADHEEIDVGCAGEGLYQELGDEVVEFVE